MTCLRSQKQKRTETGFKTGLTDSVYYDFNININIMLNNLL